jgi:predicted small lipoprotein YifL
MLLALLACAVLATALAACGRRNDLSPPPGAEKSDYPRAYPAAIP